MNKMIRKDLESHLLDLSGKKIDKTKKYLDIIENLWKTSDKGKFTNDIEKSVDMLAANNCLVRIDG